jgi:hypothetical protein
LKKKGERNVNCLLFLPMLLLGANPPTADKFADVQIDNLFAR